MGVECWRNDQLEYARNHAENRPRQPELLITRHANAAFETISILLTALGYPVFEPVIAPTVRELFTITGPEADGTGALTEDGFLVRKGSLCRREMVESAKRFRVDSARTPLIESGILIDHNDTQYIFTEDYIFNSPSGAASVILGRSSNGWTEWKNDQGQTLHEAKRATTDAD